MVNLVSKMAEIVFKVDGLWEKITNFLEKGQFGIKNGQVVAQN